MIRIEHKLTMNSQRGEMSIEAGSSIAMVPKTRQMNLSLERYSESSGCAAINTYARPLMNIATMKSNKMA